MDISSGILTHPVSEQVTVSHSSSFPKIFEQKYFVRHMHAGDKFVFM
jgi:hypothetical protein